MDEMWGRVYSKKTPCWLWHAIDQATGTVIAYLLGSRKNIVLRTLWRLLSSLGIQIERVYTDKNFAYEEEIPSKILRQGKRNTQKIERKHLTFRARLKRLARKTICYSKELEMHKDSIFLSIMINCYNCYNLDKHRIIVHKKAINQIVFSLNT